MRSVSRGATYAMAGAVLVLALLVLGEFGLVQSLYGLRNGAGGGAASAAAPLASAAPLALALVKKSQYIDGVLSGYILVQRYAQSGCFVRGHVAVFDKRSFNYEVFPYGIVQMVKFQR